jgi:hypothetical protein
VTTRYTRDRVVPTTRKPGIAQVHDGRRSDIQGLRAVAVVLVVAFHAGLPVPGGFIGVDMFFVISGFVIAGMLLRQLQQTSTLDFASFYTRRMRRILPALALLIVFAAVGSTLLLSPLGPQQATAKTGIAASLFSANLELSRAGGGAYFGLAAESNALLHTSKNSSTSSSQRFSSSSGASESASLPCARHAEWRPRASSSRPQHRSDSPATGVSAA